MWPGLLIMAMGLMLLVSPLLVKAPEGVDDASMYGSAGAFVLLGLFVLLNELQRRDPSPVRLVFARWLRWALFAFVFATLFGWLSTGFFDEALPGFTQLFLGGALLWFLYDSLFTWIAIGALSASDLTMFVRYKAGSQVRWPARPSTMRLKEFLRVGKWQFGSLFVAKLNEIAEMDEHVYLSEDKKILLKIYFIDQPFGSTAHALGLESVTQDGQVLLTDNLPAPFGGFYPENWHVTRRPWTRTPQRLLALHQRRMQQSGAWKTLEPPLLDEMNARQRQLELLNTQLGFFNPPEQREQHGNLTAAGRFRLWRDILGANYFGLGHDWE